MSYIVLDCETTGLDWKSDALHGVAICTSNGVSDYVTPDSPTWQSFLALLQDPAIAKVGHNLRFDLRFLSRFCKIEGALYDTMLMAQLVDENNSVGLKQLAERYLGKAATLGKAELDSVMGKAGVRHVGELCAADLSEERQGWFFDLIARYALEDVTNTHKLFHLLAGRLKDLDANWAKLGSLVSPLKYLREEALAVEPSLLAMELRGILLNPAAISETRTSVMMDLAKVKENLLSLVAEEVDLIEESLYEKEVGKRKSEKGKAKVERSSVDYGTAFLLSSSQHVGHLIYTHLGGKAGRSTASGLPSTSDTDLSSLRAEGTEGSKLARFLDLFATYRSLQKLWNTYVAPDSGLLEFTSNGRVHALYLQAGSSKDGGKGGTATGRLSSQSPNMQNLPRKGGIKRFFIPDPGHVFIYADYSQVELRIAAHLSRDEELLAAYKNGLDLHVMTASAVFRTSEVTKEQRQLGKTLNFAMIYDASAWRLEQELGPLGYSLQDCEAMRRAFFEKYAGYAAYLKAELRKLRDLKLVISETGRVRRLPDMSFESALQWNGRVFKGTQAQLEALKAHQGEAISGAEAFERARKRYRHAIKQAYNFPIQSLGASITKRALIALSKEGYDLVTTVHDSIIVQVPKEAAQEERQLVQHILEQEYKLSVPLIAETKILTSLEESDILSIGGRNEDKRNDDRSTQVLESNAGRL